MEEDSIEKFRHDKEIIRLTIEQIRKDFGSLLQGMIVSESASDAFDELKSQIAPVLKSLHQTNRSGLRSLLYRVDLKESEIADISASRMQELAEKIIRREFQKILIRKYFSS